MVQPNTERNHQELRKLGGRAGIQKSKIMGRWKCESDQYYEKKNPSWWKHELMIMKIMMIK
jgi:hypothetical protein